MCKNKRHDKEKYFTWLTLEQRSKKQSTIFWTGGSPKCNISPGWPWNKAAKNNLQFFELAEVQSVYRVFSEICENCRVSSHRVTSTFNIRNDRLGTCLHNHCGSFNNICTCTCKHKHPRSHPFTWIFRNHCLDLYPYCRRPPTLDESTWLLFWIFDYSFWLFYYLIIPFDHSIDHSIIELNKANVKTWFLPSEIIFVAWNKLLGFTNNQILNIEYLNI